MALIEAMIRHLYNGNYTGKKYALMNRQTSLVKTEYQSHFTNKTLLD